MNEELKKALKILKKTGLKVTNQRRDILSYLIDHQDHYISITDIDKHMRGKYEHMSYQTVYRNLQEFEQAYLVEERPLAGGKFVKYQCDFNNLDHYHFICQICGRVIELKAIGADYFQNQISGCKVLKQHVEITGICDRCLAKEAAIS
ncbi:transcriptional repressor [Oenococcus oeni]|uniref:Transcriptional repressor n=4 Tax=Oenococcus oeni TaxID=1247 RepID=A0A6N4A5F1_OENOE|nr:transcriptional repressor [Oenococcus oeni]KGH99879.1 Fur family transcriptional regulator [Oenococcus oeni IOEB_C52]OIK56729.1 transcriptional repressor [Oenococcus oeni]OIK86433.1 transcriptional repressor [Oenococcus oeni]OIL08853.1 transcriptional repressor [Oenococcus oeni]OIL13772.1 transcriptional repressor [Oenococcus oeni]